MDFTVTYKSISHLFIICLIIYYSNLLYVFGVILNKVVFTKLALLLLIKNPYLVRVSHRIRDYISIILKFSISRNEFDMKFFNFFKKVIILNLNWTYFKFLYFQNIYFDKVI